MFSNMFQLTDDLAANKSGEFEKVHHEISGRYLQLKRQNRSDTEVSVLESGH